MYDLYRILSNVKSGEDLVWLLENAVDPKKLVVVNQTRDQSIMDKLEIYRNILDSYGVNYIPISTPKDEDIHIDLDIIKLCISLYITDVNSNHILPITYDNIYNIIRNIKYPYVYSYARTRGYDWTIIRDDLVTIEDGENFTESIVTLDGKPIIKHKDGEYNIIISDKTYHTNNIMDIVFLICNRLRVPMLSGDIGLLLTQFIRYDDDYHQELADLNRSILHSDNEGYMRLYAFTSVKSVYPLVLEGEVLADAYNIIYSLT